MAQFIVLEGLDGAGTTTQSKLLKEYFGANGFWDKEPSDLPTGLKIRKILREHTPLSPKEMLSLFIKDREEHQEVLKKELLKGHKVILDRYLLSTLAYQGLDFALDYLYALNQHFLVPHITFLLDIDPEISLARLEGTKELFEKLDLQQKIRKNYLLAVDILQKAGWNIILLDGKEDIQNLHEKIVKHLEE